MRPSSPSTINVIKTRGSNSKTTATPTTNASAVKQIVSNPASIFVLALASTNWSSATYVNCALFRRVRLEKEHRQAQCPLIPNHLRQQFAVQRKNRLKNLPLTLERGLNMSWKARRIEYWNKTLYKKWTSKGGNFNLRHGLTNSRNTWAGESSDGELCNQSCAQRGAFWVRTFCAAASYRLGQYLVALVIRRCN